MAGTGKAHLRDSGDVLLRVRDSSRAPGAQTLDSISIDRIWIRTITP